MARGNVSTPFLDLRSFVREEAEVQAESFAPLARSPLGSPFVSVYELEGQPAFVSPEREAYQTLVQELYDSEFDEALFELMLDARGLHEEHQVSSPASVEGERLLTQHFNQLIREAEATVDALGREFETRPVDTLQEAELEAFAERYVPATSLGPAFEGFLGKWAKKLAKGVAGFAKKAGQFAAKLGLGPILGKLKGLVRPLLDKVLRTAIGKLPAGLRPAAQQLADRVAGRPARAPSQGAANGSANGADPAAADPAPIEPGQPDGAAQSQAVQAPIEPSVTELQQEFDQQLAQLFMASDEVEMELEVARARSAAQSPTTPVFADLDQAREHFMDELQTLSEGEDPSPHVQNFLPAVLPVLRLGVRLAGRPRVVGFLAGFLAKLIGKLVNPGTAQALSRAIVDAGLKLLTLEVAPRDEARAAASAVTATVEETLRRVSALPDYVLDDRELLEGFALEAFEQAAAANLPPVLSDAVYQQRPDLLEARHSRTCWVMLPLRRPKRYKKCARTFKVRITPYTADEIESFEGPLADYLQEQLGVEEGAEVEAEVQLFEALPGATLPEIAQAEARANTGSSGSVGAADLHPLTPRAAGLLLGEPRLGRHAPWGTGRRHIGVGQRLYRLTIPGRRLLGAPGKDGRPRPRRSGALRLRLDCAKNEIVACLFLSEVKAQGLVVRLRRKAHAGALAVTFQRYIARRLLPLLRGQRPARLRIIQAGLSPTDSLGAALSRLPADAAAALAAKLEQYLTVGFSDFIANAAQSLITASEDTADGVTLRFVIAQPAGLIELGKALLPGGQGGGLAQAIQTGTAPSIRVEAKPGHGCD